MKILLVNWQDIKHPLAGGAEVHLHEIYERIVAHGHEVVLVSCGFPHAPKREVINGIQVIRIGNRETFNFVFPFFYFCQLRKFHFDVSVLDVNKIPFFSPLLTGTPKAVIVHHFFGQAIFLEASKFAAHYVYWTEKVFFKLYRQKPILYYSPSTKKELLAQGFPEKNFHYVPIAVDLSLYRVLPDVPKADVPLCVYLGRIKRYKSVDHLVETMPTILEKIPNARFLIVGDGDDKERLEKMAVELNVSGAVEFLGFVSQEEKVRILNRAWVVVSTSSKEGWGLTMTEANACGTPVVAANSAGLRDAVIHRETGLLYEYGNREQLSASIVEVLQNNEFRNNLAKGGLLNARKFTWDDAANITIDTLNSIIGAAKV